MANLDYNIASGIRPIQLESPTNQLMQAYQLKGMQEGSQLNALRLQEAQRGIEQENKLAELYGRPGVDYASPEFAREVGSISPKQMMSHTKEMRVMAAEAAKQRKEQVDTLDKELGIFKSFVPQIGNEAGVTQYVQAMYNHPTIGVMANATIPYEQALATNLEMFRRDPNEWRIRSSSVTADKIVETIDKQDRARYVEYVRNKIQRGENDILSPTQFKSQPARPLPEQASSTVVGGGQTSMDPRAAALYATLEGGGAKEEADALQASFAARNKPAGDMQLLTQYYDRLDELAKDNSPRAIAEKATIRANLKAMGQGKGTNVNVGVKMPEGVKAVDTKYAADYLDWVQGGGADAAANAAQIKNVLDKLANGERLTGPSIGLAPGFFNAIMNPEAEAAKANVEEVVQRNLRAVLGAQFTQVEGERLIARAFDARLPPQENAKRLRKLFLQLDTAAKQKQAMADYYEEHETLRGFKGSKPSIADFEKVLSAPEAPPKGSVDRKINGKTYRFDSQEKADAFEKELKRIREDK